MYIISKDTENKNEKLLKSQNDAHNTLNDYESDDLKQQRKKRSRSINEESTICPQRRVWVKDRPKDWWEKFIQPNFPEPEFLKCFRMTKATFHMICQELEPIITKKDTMLRTAIPVSQRLGVCIWRLATGEPLSHVSKRFGLGISTCHKIVLEVCTAIKVYLMPKFLQWPDVAKLSIIKNQFQAISGIPNIGGSIYTTHIPIVAPKVNQRAYLNKHQTQHNKKNSYSMSVQGVVDPNGVFMDICIGWPGSLPNDKVLERSALLQRVNRGLLNNVWIAGNSGFPLMDWVLVPYTDQNLSWTQYAFNERIGEIQKVARESFCRLKKRWSCLQKRTEVKVHELPVLLGACCVLHNICEMKREVIDDLEAEEVELLDDEVVPENPIRSKEAVVTRDHIAHKLMPHGLAGTPCV